MLAHRTLRHFTAWLAALAVLMAVLLPALSHAVVARLVANGALIEVCTASGMAWVNPNAAPAANADAAAGSADASANPLAGNSTSPADMGKGVGMGMAGCDWCATHAPGLSLPPVAAQALPQAMPMADVPPAFLHAPRLLAVWVSAHSRAPPSAA